MQSVVLKKDKENIFRQRHHWIFSGAIHSYPDSYQEGELVPISSWNKEHLGWGFFNRSCSLAGRIVSFGHEDVYASVKKTLFRAIALRHELLYSPLTTACRLVNGEGDALPGLIVDKYGPYLVIQTGALGMHKMLPFLIECLKEKISLSGIYDKSSGKEEGMEDQGKVLWGEIPDVVTILEEGIQFSVDIKRGQKTGFFLDQREMRKILRLLAPRKRVLNCFCYTGGFTLSALAGGAAYVDSVDISASAMNLCLENVKLNGFALEKSGFYQKDVFNFLENCSGDYDLVILDPPAFAKKKKDISSAVKGYKKLFSLAMKKMPQNCQLLLSSCSYYIPETLFEKIVIEAAIEAQREPRILCRHRHAFDHPLNPYHPESAYLKSLLIVN